MNFVAAKCPQCGGDLQLDPEKEMGFCMHCGSKIVVQEAVRAVRIDNTHMIETWMKMGDSALEAGNFAEGYGYFTQVLEANPKNWLALFRKGLAAGYLSTIARPRISELLQGIKEASFIVEGLKMPPLELSVAKNYFAIGLADLIEAYTGLFDNSLASIDTKYMDLHWDAMYDTRSWRIEAIEYYKLALGFINKFTDDTSKTNVIEIKKKIVAQCEEICNYIVYFMDYGNTDLRCFGYNSNEKKPYIDLYDQLVTEILRDTSDSSYEHGYYEHSNIDRLDTPKTITSLSLAVRNAKLQEMAKQIDKQRIEMVTVYQQRKYWNEHPKELEDKKDALSMEIRDKSGQLVEMRTTNNNEIKNLTVERGKLGILSGKQKKQIDDKIKTLENDIIYFENGISALKKQLEELE